MDGCPVLVSCCSSAVVAPAVFPVPQPGSSTAPSRGCSCTACGALGVLGWQGAPVTCSGDTAATPAPSVTPAVTLVLLLQVRDWTEDERSNRGLLVTVHGLGGSPLDSPAVQFASSRDHHESKKPMLVLFTDDGRRGASLPTADFPGRCCTPQHSSVPRYLACRVLGLLLFSSG